MKTWFWYISAAAIAVGLIACGNKKQNEDVFASSPTDTNCLYGYGSCDNTYYDKYSEYGFSAYPGGTQVVVNNPNSTARYDVYNNYQFQNQNQNLQTFCSCPSGSRPVYNGSIGMGCVRIDFIPTVIQNSAYYWGSRNSNYDWVNWNQVSNISNSAGANGCFTNLAWSCFVDVQNSCFKGQSCQTIVNNSRIGICTKNK